MGGGQFVGPWVIALSQAIRILRWSTELLGGEAVGLPWWIRSPMGGAIWSIGQASFTVGMEWGAALRFSGRGIGQLPSHFLVSYMGIGVGGIILSLSLGVYLLHARRL